MIPRLITSPLRGSPRLDALVVGGGLHLLAVWLPVLPFVAVAGYLARVLSTTATTPSHTEPERPGWRPVAPLRTVSVSL